eukprot:2189102-Prymnesium_polylepis.1
MKQLRRPSACLASRACVLRVVAHRALKRPRYWPDRMCAFDCHVYFSENKTRVRLMGAEEGPRDVKRVTGG